MEAGLILSSLSGIRLVHKASGACWVRSVAKGELGWGASFHGEGHLPVMGCLGVFISGGWEVFLGVVGGLWLVQAS